MREAFLAVLARDVRALADALAQLGLLAKEANQASSERALSRPLESYAGMTLGEVRELGLASILQEIGQFLYGQSLRIPAQFAFTGQAICAAWFHLALYVRGIPGQQYRSPDQRAPARSFMVLPRVSRTLRSARMGEELMGETSFFVEMRRAEWRPCNE